VEEGKEGLKLEMLSEDYFTRLTKWQHFTLPQLLSDPFHHCCVWLSWSETEPELLVTSKLCVFLLLDIFLNLCNSKSSQIFGESEVLVKTGGLQGLSFKPPKCWILKDWFSAESEMWLFALLTLFVFHCFSRSTTGPVTYIIAVIADAPPGSLPEHQQVPTSLAPSNSGRRKDTPTPEGE